MRKCSNCGETYRGLCKCHICTHFVSMMQVLCYLVARFNGMLHLRDILGDLCSVRFDGLEHRNSAGILLDSHLMEKFKNLYDKTIVFSSLKPCPDTSLWCIIYGQIYGVFFRTVLEMIKKREKCKKELLQLTIELLDKRYDMEDYTGLHMAYAEAQKAPRPVFYPLYHAQYS